MKAKVKKTGEIIEVSRTENIITSCGVEKQYVDNNREWCTYVQSELEFIKEEPQKDIDWEQRRYEIAKDVFASTYNIFQNKGLEKMAVHAADALIAELKKGGQQ